MGKRKDKAYRTVSVTRSSTLSLGLNFFHLLLGWNRSLNLADASILFKPYLGSTRAKVKSEIILPSNLKITTIPGNPKSQDNLFVKLPQRLTFQNLQY